jgi:hypothetical protein
MVRNLAERFPSVAWAAAAVVCVHVIVGGRLVAGLPVVLAGTAWAEAACRARGRVKEGLSLGMGAVLAAAGVRSGLAAFDGGLRAVEATGMVMVLAGLVLVASAAALHLYHRAGDLRT